MKEGKQYRATDDDLPAALWPRGPNLLPHARERISVEACELGLTIIDAELDRFALVLVAMEESDP